MNSIEEGIKILENFINWLKTDFEYNSGEEIKAIEHILSDYKRVLKENEYMHNELDKQQTKINKYAKENEYYKDLLNALETYYDITEEDLEKCIKDDR